MGKCGCVGSLLPVSTQLSGRPVHGNTRAALDTTTPQINEASHILLWFDNQSQNITGEMCPKYHGKGRWKCVHWVGLFHYCKKSFLSRKMSHSGFSGAMIILVLTVDASWCSVGSRRDVDCLLPAQKNYIFELREFCLTQKHNFRHAVKERLGKSDIWQTIHISSSENLFRAPDLETFA